MQPITQQHDINNNESTALRRKAKALQIRQSKTLSHSPLENKYKINGQNIRLKNLEPYLKKFKVRRIIKTQQSSVASQIYFSNKKQITGGSALKQGNNHFLQSISLAQRKNKSLDNKRNSKLIIVNEENQEKTLAQLQPQVQNSSQNHQQQFSSNNQNSNNSNNKQPKKAININKNSYMNNNNKMNKIYGTRLFSLNNTINAKISSTKATTDSTFNEAIQNRSKGRCGKSQQHKKSIVFNDPVKNTLPYKKRIQTENVTAEKTSKVAAQPRSYYNSPYKNKYKLSIAASAANASQVRKESLCNKNQPSQRSSILKTKNQNSFVTRFQLQQIQRHDVYFIGQRRIGNIKQFTDNNGNVKISLGDAIMYRYEIKTCLGQGSFGQVFKALDHKKNEEVALKIIKNHPKFNAQAKVEIKVLENVLMHDPKSNHNIVKLKHAFFFRGHACLVFELLHINLYEFLRLNSFKGLQIDLIRRIAIQILQGLMFFKRFDIIHCDLKPQNILLKQQNKTGIKIIDVGSGCYEPQQMYTYIQSRFYRAPQIILGMPYTSAIDIWSFGCILCELYIGYPIFPGENEEEQMLMFMEVLGVPPQELLDRGSRTRKFFDEYKPRIKPNSKGKLRIPDTQTLRKKLNNCDDTRFVIFLKKCFEWQPQHRISPKQALLDQWVLEGLPEQIRQQHIEIINSEYSILQPNFN